MLVAAIDCSHHGDWTRTREVIHLRPIPKFPLPLGEGWGEGKRLSEWIRKPAAIRATLTPDPCPAERAKGGCGIGS